MVESQEMKSALRGHIEEIRASGWVGRRRVVRLAALVALLVLGTAAPPAVGSAASPGQLYAFGSNFFGELGNATNNYTSEPNPFPALVSLPGEVGPLTQADAGSGFSLAITSGGELFAFGENYYGELGNTTNNETFAANPVPTQISLPGASGPVTQVAAGAIHSLAVTSTGQLYAFGGNLSGELGNTTNYHTQQPNPTPALVTLPGASGPVTQVAAGAFHSLAVTSTGQLYAFGSNSQGQLGITTSGFTPSPTPTLVTLPGAGGPVTQVAAGGYFTLAVTSSGQLYAFGENHFGQLGNNKEPLEPHPTPTLVTLPGEVGPVTQVAAGANHSLAVTSTGQLYAFGENRFGQLGNTTNNGTQNPNSTPTLVQLQGLRGRVTRIAAGKEDSLVLTSTGQLYAFGEDYYGELGTPPGEGPERSAPHPTPRQVTLPGGANVETMATGSWANQTLVVAADLTIDTSSLPAGEIEVPYSAQAQGGGGTIPDSWSASGLPSGLSIDQSTGAISGTPTAPGTYTTTLTLTDSDGIEALTQLAIKIKRPNEEPPPPPPYETPPPPPTQVQQHEPSLLPSVQNARQAATRWRESNKLAHISRAKTPTGTTFSFSLNEQATVSLSFTQFLEGRQGGHSCLVRTHKNAKRKKSCNDTATRGTLSFTGHSGTNKVVFAGRISRTNKLQPGRYRITITATNSTGQCSVPVSLSFTIAK
jgi:alpha-tubulin suppressor-like RCC1 family protein